MDTVPLLPSKGAASQSVLLAGRFNGRKDFAELVRLAFSAAADQGWREMVLSDADFCDWPLGERAVAQCLNDWACAGRKFTMLAATYEGVARHHARFVTWRKTWSHLVDCRVCSRERVDKLPSALWSPVWAFQRLDSVRSVGMAGHAASLRNSLHEQLKQQLLYSRAGFPATTLGL